MEERYHTANVVEAFDLGAQGCFLVKITTDKVTILLCCYSTHSMNTDTAGMSYHFANHVLRHFVFVSTDRKVSISSLIQIFVVALTERISFSTDGPLSDIIWPFVRSYASWSITKFWIQTTNGSTYSSTRSTVSRAPFFPGRYRV